MDEAFAPLATGDPRLIGGYRVLARMGEGGRVFLAMTDSGRRLAISLLPAPPPGGPVDVRERLVAAQRVRGARVAAVLDAHADASRPWVAAEHVAGPSLGRALTVEGPLPPASARALLAGCAEGLAAIHGAGIAHGRLSPERIVMTAEGPRLVEFAVPPRRTRTPADDVLALANVVLAATGGVAPDELEPLIGRCLAEDATARPTPELIMAELGPDGDAFGPKWLPPAVAKLEAAYAVDPTAPPGPRRPIRTRPDMQFFERPVLG